MYLDNEQCINVCANSLFLSSHQLRCPGGWNLRNQFNKLDGLYVALLVSVFNHYNDQTRVESWTVSLLCLAVYDWLIFLADEVNFKLIYINRRACLLINPIPGSVHMEVSSGNDSTKIVLNRSREGPDTPLQNTYISSADILVLRCYRMSMPSRNILVHD